MESNITAIKAGKLINGTATTPIENATVIIEGKKIKAVGQGIEIPDEARTIDAAAKTVMPGLIDAHMHLNGPRGNARVNNPSLDGIVCPKEVKLIRAISDAQFLLSAGFTTAKSCGGINALYIKQAAAEGSLTGVPRILVASYQLINTMGNPSPYMPAEYVDARTSKHQGMPGGLCLICDGVDECIKSTRYCLSLGSDFIKICARNGSYHNLDEMKAIVNTAAEGNKSVAIHTENSLVAEMAILAGVKTIDHATGVDDETIEKGKEAGVIFVSTLAPLQGYMEIGAKTGMPPANMEWAKLFLEGSIESYKKIRKLGGTLAIGTDYGANPFVRDMGGSAIELELLVKYCDFTPMEAIVSATRNSAMACFMEDKTGTIEPGKYADIIIVDGNPLLDITILKNLENIHMVIMEGSVVIER